MIVFSEEALADLERILDFNKDRDPATAPRHLDVIREAILILDGHPRIGRAVGGRMRELVISHGNTGYIALYEYREVTGTVLIAAIRHQREAGYRGS